jgi:hypothetical protein
MPIERAIFTSAERKDHQGYHLVCRSDGVCEADARELSQWGPTHDALLDDSPRGQSINFFRLASGSYCVSRTMAAGDEYSQRGGQNLLTHFLIVGQQDLARFANNPFAVICAAVASGELECPPALPQWQDPLPLLGRAAKVDHSLLLRLAHRLPPDDIVELIKVIFSARQLWIATTIEPDLLVAGLVNSLPIERRLELTFTTGLRYSAPRPFRLGVLPAAATNELRQLKQLGVPVLSLLEGAVC